MKKYLLIILLCFSACIKPDTFPDEPAILSISLDRNVVPTNDKFNFFIEFTDGEGNIGTLSEDDPSYNIFITDLRTDFLSNFASPDLCTPESCPSGSDNDIKGQMIIEYSTCCIIENTPYCVPTAGIPTNDMVVFDIQIQNRKTELFSNTIQSPPIQIRCVE